MLSHTELSKCVIGNPIFVVPERYLPYKDNLAMRGIDLSILTEYPNSFGHITGFGIVEIDNKNVLALTIKTSDGVLHTISDKKQIIFLRN